jgi:hypothetical protein
MAPANASAALTVLDTMMTSPTSAAGPSRPFVYVSASDCFRPVVPRRYIETKREAESEILRMCLEKPEAGVRPVFMRPGECCVIPSRFTFTACLARS